MNSLWKNPEKMESKSFHGVHLTKYLVKRLYSSNNNTVLVGMIGCNFLKIINKIDSNWTKYCFLYRK